MKINCSGTQNQPLKLRIDLDLMDWEGWPEFIELSLKKIQSTSTIAQHRTNGKSLIEQSMKLLCNSQNIKKFQLIASYTGQRNLQKNQKPLGLPRSHT